MEEGTGMIVRDINGFYSAGEISGTVNNYFGREAEDTGADAAACLRSLLPVVRPFASSRKEPTPGTCNWLLGHKSYQAWRSSGGLFWITGRPGCGKSILMKFAAAADRKQKSKPPASVLSFAYQRGDKELAQPQGLLFRTLLHQMLEDKEHAETLKQFTADTGFARRCQTRGPPGAGQKWDWEEPELRVLFKTLANRFFTADRPARIYLDALDLAGKDAAVSLISLFRELDGHVAVCFCSTLSLFNDDEVDMVLDPTKENASAISTFIDVEFQRVVKSWSLEERCRAKDYLVKKAAGLFQWVFVIIQRIEELVRQKVTAQTILRQIKRSPKSLNRVYERVLEEIEEDDLELAMRLFEWITLARRPLSLVEL